MLFRSGTTWSPMEASGRLTVMNEQTLSRGARIFVAGHRGLVGGAIVRALRREGFDNLLTVDRATLDLRDGRAVTEWFSAERPEVVFLCAARVGGIMANSTRPVEFLVDNLAIQNNVIQAAHELGVERLVFLGSSCIYPRDAVQPIREEYLLEKEPDELLSVATVRLAL